MNKSKIYFISSITINALLLVSELLVFFNPNALVYRANGFPSGYVGTTIILTLLISLPLALFLFFWGLWLIFRNKIRNWLVITGLIACIILLLITATFVQIRNEQTKCGDVTGNVCAPNPL